MSHDNKPGVRPYGLFDLLQRDTTIIGRENGEGEPPFPFKCMQGAEYRVVLQFSGNRVERRFLVFHKPVDHGTTSKVSVLQAVCR